MLGSILRSWRSCQSLSTIVPVTRNFKSNAIFVKDNGLIPLQGYQTAEIHYEIHAPDHVSYTHQFRQSSINVRGPEVVYFWDKLKKCFGSKKGDKKKKGKKAKKQSCKKKKCGKQKDSCLKKKDSCEKPDEKKELCKIDTKKDEKKGGDKKDPCKKKEVKEDPCKMKEEKKEDPCKKKEEKKEDPCKKKEEKKDDPCKKKEEKKEDPCKKKEEKKEDPCKKKEEKKKEDPCKKKEEKKEDPCKKKEEKKKEDPCKKKEEKKKEDPCKKKAEKKEDPCKKKEDPSKKKEEKKEDPCKKKEDPSKKKEDTKEDPCMKKEEKKEDPCKKKEDPCKKKEEKKKEDPCKKKEDKKDDPCKKKEDPCKKKEEKKEDPCAPCNEEKDPCRKKDEKKEDPCKKKEDPCKKKDLCAKFTPDNPNSYVPFVFFTCSDAFHKKEEKRCSKPCKDPCAEGSCDVLPGQDEPCSVAAPWKIKVRPCRRASPCQSKKGGVPPSGPCIIDKVEIVEQKLEPEDNCGLTKHPCGKKVCPNKCDVKRKTKFSDVQEEPRVAIKNLVDDLSYQTRSFQSIDTLNFANARGTGPMFPNRAPDPSQPGTGQRVPGSDPPSGQTYSEKVAGLLEKLKGLWQGSASNPVEVNQQVKGDKHSQPGRPTSGRRLFGMLESEMAVSGIGESQSISAAASLESLSAEGDSHILFMTDDFLDCEDKIPPCPLEPEGMPCPARDDDCIRTTDDIWSDIDTHWGYEKFPWKSNVVKDERLDEVSKGSDDPYANHQL